MSSKLAMPLTDTLDAQDAPGVEASSDSALGRPSVQSEPRSVLDDVSTASGWPTQGVPFVVECLDVRHPTLAGRVSCRLVLPGGAHLDRWVPTLMGLAIRPGDRLLAVWPLHHAEPVVTGVLDGFTARPEPPRAGVIARPLLVDEVIRFESSSGQALVEIAPGAHGPVVRLLSTAVDLETPGRLRIRAGELDLAATHGDAKIAASDDVVVQGEAIRLN